MTTHELALSLPLTIIKDSPFLSPDDDFACLHSPDGFLVNQYYFVRTLGAGMQGVVFHVCDTTTNQEYAVKAALGARDPSTVTQKLALLRNAMATECVALAKVGRHPNVAALREVIEDPGRKAIYLVLEYGGTSLAQAAAAPGDPLNHLSIATQLVEGLRYIHSRGVIHCDIKPDNILRASDGTVQFTDFGVAQVCDSGATPTLEYTKGTPAFLPPELVAGQSAAVAAKPVDVWALGVTLYTLMFKKLPWTFVTRAELTEQILRAPIDVPADALCGALAGMLRREPSQRSTLDAVAAQLRSCP